jgi:selenocysteine lyase/cysteine desulfurase
VQEQGALSVVDGVGYAPHAFPDLKELGADIYLFSTYKTFGPHLGVMYVNRKLIRKMENQSHYFKEGITGSMITPAGPDHAQIAAVSGILDYFDLLYAHHFEKDDDAIEKVKALNTLFQFHEKELMDILFDFLNSRQDIQVLGPTESENRLPIISILPKNKKLKDLYAALTKHKLMLGKGHFYAVRPLIDMGIPIDPGVLRISFLHYTSKSEINQLISGFEQALDT